jgi:uncharacterized protein involved in exopolysaccharide biosynthesis
MEKENTPPVLALSPGPMAGREMDYYDLESEGRTHLRDLFHILLKRKWWVIGTLFGVMALTALVILTMTPIYKATTMVQITQDNPGSSLSDLENLSVLKGGLDVSKFQETQYNILTSRGVAARVIEALNLQDTPEFKAPFGQVP